MGWYVLAWDCCQPGCPGKKTDGGNMAAAEAVAAVGGKASCSAAATGKEGDNEGG